MLYPLSGKYFHHYAELIEQVGKEPSFQRNRDRVVDYVKEARADKARCFFIGNGGSAATAMHFATDFQKAAKIPSMSFTCPSDITALGNDCGYSSTYSDQLAHHGRHGDILFALSASGESPNILLASKFGRERGLVLVTLSGFKDTNALRGIGHVNFHVPSEQYGLVEVVHMAILHNILDRIIYE